MAARPTQLPEWATGAGATVVPPSAGKKALGWITDERPLAQYVNWILFTIYSWLGYLDNGPRSVRLPAADGYSIGALWTITNGYKAQYSGTSTSKDWWWALPLKEGDIITSADFRILSGIATNEIVCQILVYDDNTAALAYSKQSTTPGVIETLDISSADSPTTGVLPYTLGANEHAYLTLGGFGGGSAQRTIYWAEYQATIATDKD